MERTGSVGSLPVECPRGHVGGYRAYPRKDTPRGWSYKCAPCRNWRTRTTQGAPRTFTPWGVVEDTLNYWSAFYGPARATEEATRQLGITAEAMGKHLKRRGYVFPA